MNRLKRDPVNIEELGNYLAKNYFTGFWSKYHLRITLCRPADNVLIEVPDLQWVHCYSFFDTLSRDIGFNLPESNFFYLDYQVGRISYLGRFPFLFDEPPYEITLFIELDSRLTRNLLGYPELLLDKELQKERLIERYSYAKYYKENLVMQSGDFSYSLSSDLFGTIDSELQSIKLDDYNQAGNVAPEIEKIAGGYPFVTKTWFELNKSLYSWMTIEKWGAFVILCLIITVAAFNIVSSLIMIVMEKTREIGILKSMGASSQGIMKIFLFEGVLVGLIGTILGNAVGFTVSYLQQTFGLLKLPPDVYLIDSLPMKMQLLDFLAISVAAILLCLIASVYPAFKASRLEPVEAIRYE